MLERVVKTITRYNMLPPGSRVAVGVSGGMDSVCLLVTLVELASTLGISLSVAHFNHHLRGAASDADERFVAQLAGQLNLQFHRGEGQVGASKTGQYNLAKGNLEQAGRRARARFFAQLISEGCADRIAIGHTRDDQAETVLFRILRGSGLRGLAAIHPVTAEYIVRPLLEVTRADVAEFHRSRGLESREDESNRDERFARNRIRHSLLPQLKKEWNPKLGASLAHLADLAYEEEQYWNREIDTIAGRLLRVRLGAIEMEAQALAQLPRAVGRRLIRKALADVKGDLRQLEFQHIETVLELAVRPSGKGRLVLPGIEAIRSFDLICLRPSANGLLASVEGRRERVPAMVLVVPGTVVAMDGSRIQLEIIEDYKGLKKEMVRGRRGSESRAQVLSHPEPHPSENGATLKTADIDLRSAGLGLISPVLELRGWRAGDHYQPQGHARDHKVKEMFQRAKVPSWRRPFWPIVTDGKVILWAKQFGAAAALAAGPDAGPILRVSCADEEDG